MEIKEIIKHIEEIFVEGNEEDRVKLWERLYLRIGLSRCAGIRVKTCYYLGLSERGLRNKLNRHPDIKKEYKSQHDSYNAFYEALNKDAYPWYQSKKKKYLEMKEREKAKEILA